MRPVYCGSNSALGISEITNYRTYNRYLQYLL